MNYLQNIFVYFENVFHPAGGKQENVPGKRKRKAKKDHFLYASPESFNIRGGNKKLEKLRRNPAP